MFTAIIPVRAGSRRVKDKNIRPFGDSNLLIHKIRQLKKVPKIDKIVVSSDSDLMLDMAKKEGVLVHKRDPEYCDEKTKSWGEVVRNVCENVTGEHIVWAQCTSPLIEPEQYSDAIEKYLENLGPCDSLISVEPFKKYVWDEKGPVNYKIGKSHVPSQQLPQWYFITGVFIAPREKMIEWIHNLGKKPYLYPLSKISALDIDDEVDFEVAQIFYEKSRKNKK